MTSSNDQQPAEPATGTAAAFGAALKARRNRTGRSLEAVAQRVGLSTSTLSRYERGECLPSDKHLDTICNALGISIPERPHLLDELQQARANSSPERPKKPPRRQHRLGAGVEAIGRHWRTGVRVIVVAFALVGIAATVGYLIPDRQADPDHGQVGHHAAPQTAGSAPAKTQPTPGDVDCDRYTVASADLNLRDFYGGPTIKLPRQEALTIIQRSHPRGLPYWEVTTQTNQQGWVDFHYLRPACE